MKVFISWSGPLSKQLGEAFRDWLPGVLQLVTPYFTPSDIEKGTRWSTDIAKELESSQVGVLCVTRDNIHSDWILFEAGALSKSLDKSNVCPILFGISPTDLAGPLKQFQTTSFQKSDMHKLLSVINSRLGDHKLAPKTLDAVFEKWWPDLEKRINDILAELEQPEEPLRTDRELIEEILLLSRAGARRVTTPGIAPGALSDLLESFIELHNDQCAETGGYQATLNTMQKMQKPLAYMASRYEGTNEKLDERLKQFRSLTYTVAEKESILDDDDIPF